MKPFPQRELELAYGRALHTSHFGSRSGPLEINENTWQSVPLTTKDDLRKSYPFGLLSTSLDRLSSYHESSGTSGSPISSLFTENDWSDIYERFLRSRVALKSSDMVLIKTPYALVTTAHQMHGAAKRVGATIVPADNRSLNMPYSRVLRLLRDLPITVVWCLPTEAVIWGYLAKRQGLDPAVDFPHIRAFIVAGESLSSERKADISRIWGGKDVIEDYGSTETGSLAGECAHGHLHVWSDRLHFEVLEENASKTRATGTGSLIVTPLYREAMALIRYNLEDQVHLRDDKCPCGTPAARIEILGRKLAAIDGLYPRDLEKVIFTHGRKIWFWRARTSHDSLEVEFHAENADAKALEIALEQKFNRRVRVRAITAKAFVPSSWLSVEATMQKPRYVYSENEDWSKSLNYF